jgi:hypothetical protein
MHQHHLLQAMRYTALQYRFVQLLLELDMLSYPHASVLVCDGERLQHPWSACFWLGQQVLMVLLLLTVPRLRGQHLRQHTLHLYLPHCNALTARPPSQAEH